MIECQHIPSDFPFFDQAAATDRFLADAAREAAAMKAIGSYADAAGYSCSRFRSWNRIDETTLECVCDLYIDDIRIGDMKIKVAFGEANQITDVAGAIGHLLDIRQSPST